MTRLLYCKPSKWLTRGLRKGLTYSILGAMSLLPYTSCGPSFESIDSKSSEFSSSIPLGEDGAPLDDSGNSILYDGVALYRTYCATCHFPLESSNLKNRAAEEKIKFALGAQPAMVNLEPLLNDEQIKAIASVLVSTSTGQNGSGGSGGSGGSNEIPSNIVCNLGDDPAPTNLARLSKRQYENAMIRLLNDGGLAQRTIYSQTVQGVLAPEMSMVPEDNVKVGFSRLDKTLTESHVDGYATMAMVAASRAVISGGFLSKYKATCVNSTTILDSCVKTLIETFGARAMRRPLLKEEVDSYMAVFNEYKTSSPKTGVEVIIGSILLSPEFLFQVEVMGEPVASKTNVYTLTPYELAARVSLGLEDNIPSDALWKEVVEGRFSTDQQMMTYLEQAFIYVGKDKYIETIPGSMAGSPFTRLPDLQDHYLYFFNEWLELDESKDWNYSEDKLSKAFLQEGGITRINWEIPAKYPSYFSNEIREMTVRNMWVEEGKFSTLMTDAKFWSDLRFNQAYGYRAWEGLPSEHRLHPDRKGFLTRMAYALTGNNLTKPIARGVFIRRKLLCDELPSPDFDALPDRALEAPDLNPTMTTRQRYAEKTKDSACVACHAQINPLGFALENFDSLGRLRTMENIYSEVNGTARIVASLPIDAEVNDLNFGGGETSGANGGNELTERLASSPKAQMCFVRQAFRYVFGRTERENDSCLLKHMHQNLEGSGGSMRSMFMKIVTHPHFRTKKVGS